MQTLPVFKAGDTFAYGGTVSGLERNTSWVAGAQMRNRDAGGQPGELVGAPLTVSLVPAPDYGQTGNLVISLTATAVQTGSWAGPAGPRTLLCDIRFSAVGQPDPVLHSETFQVPVTAPVT